jgi:hypothetical protein
MSSHIDIDKFFGNVVSAGATDIELSPAIPSGKKVYIGKFGCFCRCQPQDAIVAIQWGDNTNGFTTLRAIGGVFELEVNRVFVGDGLKQFRLVRQNKGTVDFEIAAWFEAIVKD